MRIEFRSINKVNHPSFSLQNFPESITVRAIKECLMNKLISILGLVLFFSFGGAFADDIKVPGFTELGKKVEIKLAEKDLITFVEAYKKYQEAEKTGKAREIFNAAEAFDKSVEPINKEIAKQIKIPGKALVWAIPFPKSPENYNVAIFNIYNSGEISKQADSAVIIAIYLTKAGKVESHSSFFVERGK